MVARANVGIIGCGNISDTYFKNCAKFENLRVAACADLDASRAAAKAATYNIRALTVPDLLNDPEVDLVINLTVPQAHTEVNLAALAAGKHVYTEKPLAVAREDGRRTLEAAQTKGLRVGSAPDTFLGAGLQTCRKLIDDGVIGEPVAATAFMLGHGPESWHPDPEFFYKAGAGPMFDMGPYYLTALISLLGPVRRVTGSARISFAERTITSQPHYGKKIVVETPTHLAAVLDLTRGPVATLITSFDVWGGNVPRIEIYGSEGSLSVPDPNTFGGTIKLRRANAKEWEDVAYTHGYAQNSRGLGTADLAQAIASGRPHRASGALAYHVLDIMHAVHEASREGRHIELTSGVERPAPLPVGLPEGQVDA
jgi:predicted dehydrogenase